MMIFLLLLGSLSRATDVVANDLTLLLRLNGSLAENRTYTLGGSTIDVSSTLALRGGGGGGGGGARPVVACFAVPCLRVTSGASLELAHAEIRVAAGLSDSQPLFALAGATDVILRDLLIVWSGTPGVLLAPVGSGGAAVSGKVLVANLIANQTVAQVFAAGLIAPVVRAVAIENSVLTCQRSPCVEFRAPGSTLSFTNASIYVVGAGQLVSVPGAGALSAPVDAVSFVGGELGAGSLALEGIKTLSFNGTLLREPSVAISSAERVLLDGVRLSHLVSSRTAAYFQLKASVVSLALLELSVANTDVTTAMTTASRRVQVFSVEAAIASVSLRNVSASYTRHLLALSSVATLDPPRTLTIDTVRLSNALLLESNRPMTTSIRNVELVNSTLAEHVISFEGSASATFELRNVSVLRSELETVALLFVEAAFANALVEGVTLRNSRLQSMFLQGLSGRVADVVFGDIAVVSTALSLLIDVQALSDTSNVTVRDVVVSSLSAFSSLAIDVPRWSARNITFDALLSTSNAAPLLRGDVQSATGVRFTNFEALYTLFEKPDARGTDVVWTDFLVENVTSPAMVTEWLDFTNTRTIVLRNFTFRNCSMKSVAQAAVFHYSLTEAEEVTIDRLVVTGFTGNVVKLLDARVVNVSSASISGVLGVLLQTSAAATALTLRDVDVAQSGTIDCKATLPVLVQVDSTTNPSLNVALERVRISDVTTCGMLSTIVAVNSAKSVKVHDCVFERLKAVRGALLVNRASVDVARTRFDRITGPGLAAFDATGPINVTDSYFANIDDGAFQARKCTGLKTVSRCRFFSNAVNTAGAAVHVADGPATVTASVFRNNSATVRGGAIFFSGSQLRVEESDFVGNRVDSDDSFASAVYATSPTPMPGAAMRLVNVSLSNNSVQVKMRTNSLGAVHSLITIDVSGVCICNNTARDDKDVTRRFGISCGGMPAPKITGSGTFQPIDGCNGMGAVNRTECDAGGCALRQPELHLEPPTQPPFTPPLTITLPTGVFVTESTTGEATTGGGGETGNSSGSGGAGNSSTTSGATAAAATTTTTTEGAMTGGDGNGALIGAVVGGVGGALLLLALLLYCLVRRRRARQGGVNPYPDTETPTAAELKPGRQSIYLSPTTAPVLYSELGSDVNLDNTAGAGGTKAFSMRDAASDRNDE